MFPWVREAAGTAVGEAPLVNIGLTHKGDETSSTIDSATAWVTLGTLFFCGAAGSPGITSLVHRAACSQCWRQSLKLRCSNPFFFPFPLSCQA